MRRLGVLIALCCAALLAPAAATAQVPSVGAQAADVLPDLDQALPGDLQVRRVVRRGRARFHLGFSSAAANVGDGPLTLLGHRRSRKVVTMDVDQLVDQRAGAPRTVRDVGLMSYVVHPDHRHWHLLGFERYELRVPGGGPAPVARDRKTGFCLGDRYRVTNAAALPGFSPIPEQADMCGEGEPGLTGLFTGISVGWVDRYEAHIEGQYIDITGLPAGRYELVHRVNTDGRIVERDLSNNASSVLFALDWRRRRDRLPRVRVLRRCPNTATCS